MPQMNPQPEVGPGFAAGTGSDPSVPHGEKPATTSETAGLPALPARKAEAVTKVMRQRVHEQGHGAEDAIIALPDRTH
jgi:hypothetical protein